MTPEVFSFEVGALSCHVISDGIAESAFDAVTGNFPSVPEDEMLAALRQYHAPQEKLPRSLNCLLIRSPDMLILLDTGLGFVARPHLGRLADNLRAAGVSPQEVDAIVISHCHRDHVGGLVDAQGELVFPNANVAMAAAEWQHWMGAGRETYLDKTQISALDSALFPIQPRLTLLEAETELTAGVRLSPALGHTSGHLCLLAESNGEQLLNIGDAIHYEVQLQHTDWSPRFDARPELSQVTRRKLLERAAAEGLLTMVFHFPFSGLGHVHSSGSGFVWQPVGS